MIESALYAGQAEHIIYTNPAEYEFTLSAVAHNHDITTLTSLELNLPFPTEWPEVSVSNIVIEGDGASNILKNTEGPGRLIRGYYEGQNLPRQGQNRSLRITYRAVVKEIKANKELLAKTDYPPYIIDYEYRYYTTVEPRMPCDDPRIIEIANKMKAETNNPCQLAKKAYDYVIDNMSYGDNPPDIIAEKRGNCGAYVTLFVIICRAAGIPARPVAGSWCQGDNNVHCWAEFLLPGVGWIPADPTIGQQGETQREYCFGNLDNNHLPLMKCFNSKYDAPKGSQEAGFVQGGYWLWFYGPGSEGRKITCEMKIHGEKSKKIKFSGAWQRFGPLHCSRNIGATAEYSFEGTTISWIGRYYDDAGRAAVEIDGKLISTVDQYGPVRDKPFVWTYERLDAGRHIIRLTVIQEKDPNSKANWVNIEKFLP